MTATPSPSKPSPTPSSPQVSASAVQQLLEQDITNATALLALLQEEHDVLQQRDHARLGILIHDKQTLMAALEQNASQRSAWVRFLVERTQLSSEACWERLLNELDSVQLPPLWTQLQAVIAECKTHNEVNGKMIARGQKTLQQLTGLMRGQSVEAPSLYTASGNTQARTHSHTVVKA